MVQILSITYAISPEETLHPSEKPPKLEEKPLHLVLNNTNNMTAAVSNSKPASNTTIIKQTIDNSDMPKIKDNVDSGAMIRGFYVFLGLSLLTIFYFLFKTYRLRNGSQPPTQVRKYGVLTRRGDVEMLPLPLDDDDEDDTVFDLGNHSTDQQNSRSVFAHS